MTTTGSNAAREELYTQQRFLFMTLDPVHIGAGGYRLGRVDMTIAREPGTQLPKIPGTSLAGAARSYAAMRYGKTAAAGQHKDLKTEQKLKCPIIYTFGTATDTSETATPGTSSEGPSQAGTVSIGDAHILFFPVNSMAGPVWVSTIEMIKEAWGKGSVKLPKNGQQEIEPTSKIVLTSLEEWDKDILNLGWLLFKSRGGLKIEPPQEVQSRSDEWSAIARRIVLVDTKLFSQIVNSNLEVRTSVSIDPKTGAASEGALFTYEAIPRTTWLYCDVIEDDYRKKNSANYPFPVTQQYNSENGKDRDGKVLPKGEQWDRPIDVVKAGMRLIEYLGIGGMGTRGFGRMRLVAPREAGNGGAKNERSQ
jgi:CRISPR-associated protein Cmr4